MTYLEEFHKIKAFVFDVDGVLTNGQVILLPDGQQMRHMHSKDGYAIQLAIKKGYPIAIITGGNSKPIKDRLNALGVTDVFLKCSHKDEAMDEFMHAYHLESSEVMYMGDDIPDLSAMQMVGLPACPADAAMEIKNICKFQSKKKGGEGCVRDIIEQIMKTQETWFNPETNLDNIASFTW